MDIISTRYSTPFMRELFSEKNKYTTWRKLWISLADAERECGLNITNAQINEMVKNIDNIDYIRVAQIEKETNHDVMSHLKHFGEVCPNAKGIMHLGATSCYITDNTDLIIYRDGMNYIITSLWCLIQYTCKIMEKYKDLVVIGYTHYQAAQLETLGKRFTIYCQDMVEDLFSLQEVRDKIRFLGCRGAVGTEDSFMELFNGDTNKIDKMQGLIATSFGFKNLFAVSGQTYTRKLDSMIGNSLSGVAETLYKIATDIRLMQHDKILYEPFGNHQVGSSAMPYKKNPMMCERICSIARHVINVNMDTKHNYMSQWFERTLDDSANRRICMEEMFTLTQYIISSMYAVFNGLVVNTDKIKKDVDAHIPYACTERIMMEIVKAGKGDRNEIHEYIRNITTTRNDLTISDLESILKTHFDVNIHINPLELIGRSIEQTELFKNIVKYLNKKETTND